MAWGCIPKKTLVRAANVINLARRAQEFGVLVGSLGFDWTAVIERKRAVVRSLSGHKRESLEERSIVFFPTPARFVSPEEVDVDGRRLRPKRVIICTGARPRILPISGAERTITSNEALDLDAVPASLVMIGGGYIAMEFCHILRSFGAEITILDSGDRILGEFDPDISAALTEVCNRERFEIHNNSRVVAVDGIPGDLTVTATTPEGERRFRAETVMMAAGRAPNVEGLGLDEVGIRYSEKGIEVDDELRTSVPHVYAAGDITGGIQLTPVASMEGRIAANNALTDKPINPDYRLVTSAVFTVQEAASVGLKEDDARERGFDVAVSRYELSELGSAIVTGETEGFVKTVFDAKTRKILGVHIVGAEASEMVHLGAMAMYAGWTPEDLEKLVMIHPSLSEGFLASVTSMRTGHQEGCCG